MQSNVNLPEFNDLPGMEKLVNRVPENLHKVALVMGCLLIKDIQDDTEPPENLMREKAEKKPA